MKMHCLRKDTILSEVKLNINANLGFSLAVTEGSASIGFEIKQLLKGLKKRHNSSQRRLVNFDTSIDSCYFRVCLMTAGLLISYFLKVNFNKFII